MKFCSDAAVEATNIALMCYSTLELGAISCCSVAEELEIDITDSVWAPQLYPRLSFSAWNPSIGCMG
jgi:hypothetical protein